VIDGNTTSRAPRPPVRPSTGRLLVGTAGAAGLALVALSVTLCCAGSAEPEDGTRLPPASTGVDVDALPMPRVASPRDLGARAFAHIAELVSYGARYPGSEGHSRAVDYIASTLSEAGLEPVLDRWTVESEGLELCNVVARIPGRIPERIVIGCHHDTKKTSGHDDPSHNFEFVGANDSGSGVGLLLELARCWAADGDLPVTVEVVFFDGEESVPFRWDIERALFGSRHYVANYREARMLGLDTPAAAPILAFVLLDLVGSRDLQIDDDELSDALLKRIVARAARLHGHESIFFKTFTRVTDDHVPFLDAGIPAIDLIDIADNPQWHRPTDTLEHLAPESLQIVGEVVRTALPAIAAALAPDVDRLRLGGEDGAEPGEGR
jgi:glutaminyl-peptide cyclotransferase